MERSGMSASNLKLVANTYSLKNGGDAFESLLAHTPRPTAVMCGNDVLATGAISRAIEMGIRIPEDISVTGFDDIDLAEVIRPKLTTVQVPHRRMGEAAARLVMDVINGETEPQGIELETSIVIRESLGPANP
jgi:LacI family transcriptional regulator